MGTRREEQVEVVVLDTNVLVSAAGWRGPERRVYDLCRAGCLQLVTSPALLAELERVFRYPKFQLTDTHIRELLGDVIASAEVVDPTQRITVVERDPDDNRVLECAVDSGARWIVSGDPDLLELGEYEGIEIVTAAELLRRLAA